MMKEKWTIQKYQQYLAKLASYQEEAFCSFQKKLIPTKDPILGVRTPILQKFAKEIAKTDVISFLESVTDTYYEEKVIEGMVIATLRDQKLFAKYFDRFIPKVDNWATCDLCCARFKIIARYKEAFYPQIKELVQSKEEFKSRIGLVLLMNYYLDEDLSKIFSLIEQMKTNGYYAQMAASWLLSVAFVKQYNQTYTYLKENRLPKEIHNKAISKANDSYRLTPSQKQALKQIKRI